MKGEPLHAPALLHDSPLHDSTGRDTTPTTARAATPRSGPQRSPASVPACSPPPPRSRQAPRSPAYVALGDSYSSGVGTRSYLNDGTSCQRSVYTYLSLIASAKGYALNFRACSGATVADVTNTQLSALSASTAYVTMSVGGNDAGFASVLTTCAAVVDE